MKPGDEDEAWRQIVENYGARPSIDDLTEGDTLPEESAGSTDDRFDEFDTGDSTVYEAPLTPEPPEPRDPLWMHSPDPWEDEGRFVPPPPPPIPLAEPKRLLAWIGLFGAPLLVLLSVVSPLRYPGWLSMLLMAWFVGGFVYLVATMPGGRDPWDDGSRI